MTFSHALVESSTFSENFWVAFANSEESSSSRLRFSSGKSAPASRKSAASSSSMRLSCPSRALPSSDSHAAFRFVQSLWSRQTLVSNSVTFGSISLYASRNSSEFLTWSKCETTFHLYPTHSNASQISRATFFNLASSAGIDRTASSFFSACSRARVMSGITCSGFSADHGMWKESSRNGFIIKLAFIGRFSLRKIAGCG